MHMRAEETRQRIVEAFVGLLEEKAGDAITVDEVLLRAKVGRSTYYRYFAGGVDAIAGWLVDQIVGRVAPTWDDPHLGPEDEYDTLMQNEFTEDAYAEWFECHREVKALIDGGYRDLLRERVLPVSLEKTNRFEWNLVDPDGECVELTPTQRDYWVYASACTIFGFIECWASRDFAETPKELADFTFFLRTLSYGGLSRPERG